MKLARIFAVLGAAALAACSTDRPEHGRRGPGGPGAFSDGVPPADCLLKPMAGADGALTRTELEAGIKAAYGAADTDRDGWLSGGEVKQWNAAQAGGCDRSPLIDWKSTGRIGLAEFASRYRTAFERSDTDGDGIVSADEMKARPHMRGPNEDGERRGPPGERRRGPGGPSASELEHPG